MGGFIYTLNVKKISKLHSCHKCHHCGEGFCQKQHLHEHINSVCGQNREQMERVSHSAKATHEKGHIVSSIDSQDPHVCPHCLREFTVSSMTEACPYCAKNLSHSLNMKDDINSLTVSYHAEGPSLDAAPVEIVPREGILDWQGFRVPNVETVNTADTNEEPASSSKPNREVSLVSEVNRAALTCIKCCMCVHCKKPFTTHLEPEVCPLCNKEFSNLATKNQLNCHTAKAVISPMVSNTEGDANQRTGEYVLPSIKEHTPSYKSCICPHCMKKVTSFSKPDACPHCSKSLNYSPDTKQKACKIRPSSSIDTRACPHCNKSLQSFSSYTNCPHCKTALTNSFLMSLRRSFECSSCGKEFKIPLNMKVHVCTHGAHPRYGWLEGKCPHCKKEVIPHSMRLPCSSCRQELGRSSTLTKNVLSPGNQEHSDKPTSADIACTKAASRGQESTGPAITDIAQNLLHELHQDRTSSSGFSDRTPHAYSHCQERFVHASDLEEYFKTHSLDEPHRCPCCNKQFTSLSGLKDHLDPNKGKKSYICHCCKKSFHDKVSLRIHQVTHTGGKAYMCPHCWKIVTSTSKTCDVCTFCNKKLSLPSGTANVLRVHAQQAPPTVTTLGTETSQQTETPLLSHQRDDSYVCPHCKKGITSTPRPHVCPHCKKTIQITVLSDVETDSVKNPLTDMMYMCLQCKECFAQVESLREHLSTHLDVCPHCQNVLISSANMDVCTSCNKPINLPLRSTGYLPGQAKDAPTTAPITDIGHIGQIHVIAPVHTEPSLKRTSQSIVSSHCQTFSREKTSQVQITSPLCKDPCLEGTQKSTVLLSYYLYPRDKLSQVHVISPNGKEPGLERTQKLNISLCDHTYGSRVASQVHAISPISVEPSRERTQKQTVPLDLYGHARKDSSIILPPRELTALSSTPAEKFHVCSHCHKRCDRSELSTPDVCQHCSTEQSNPIKITQNQHSHSETEQSEPSQESSLTSINESSTHTKSETSTHVIKRLSVVFSSANKTIESAVKPIISAAGETASHACDAKVTTSCHLENKNSSVCPYCQKEFTKSTASNTNLCPHCSDGISELSAKDSFKTSLEPGLTESAHSVSAPSPESTSYKAQRWRSCLCPDSKDGKNASLRMKTVNICYECPNCDKGFSSSKHFRTHFHTHTTKKCYAGLQHDDSSPTESDPSIHHLVDVRLDAYICPLCDDEFVEPHLLTRHMKVHIRGSTQTFPERDKISLRSTQNEKQYNLRAKPLRSMKAVTKNCVSWSPVNCKSCIHGFKQEQDLKDHLTFVHRY